MEMKVNSFSDLNFGSTGAQSAFQWGGTIFALFLLLMNRIGQRSHMLTNLLVLYLFASFPTVLFEIVRGQFGCWVAFLAVALRLFFPDTFPGSKQDFKRMHTTVLHLTLDNDILFVECNSFAFHPVCHYARLVGR
ncbi:hypothetical protein J1N35_019803 [Gossypium stocksii]|uniref:Uncharacterized protein n=1 Tax=Gossypium stocksii TaxID=47602 RepID=A0A9D3VD48_9ROSI|nr:hypothetical protein J1N35_019803 [Gossypium stocksii]